MAEKAKCITVIKKITISGGGHHGGAWKVAFADFMTAMMAFFLCMWLLSISPEARQSISDYFSTPSVIEYQFRNFGVELTLEKLFADLLNEPLDTVAKLIEPMDKTPNVFEFNDDKIALSFIADAIGKDAEKIEANNSELSFWIPDNKLFLPGTSEVTSDFINIMNKIKRVVSGLQDSRIQITSELHIEAVSGQDPVVANEIAQARLDYITLKVKSSLEHESTEVIGAKDVKSRGTPVAQGPMTGYIRFQIFKSKAAPSTNEATPKESQLESQEPREVVPNQGPDAPTRDLYDELNKSFVEEVRKK